MNAMQADDKTDIAVPGRQSVKRDAEQMWRDNDNLRWQVGLWIMAVVTGGTLTIRWLPDEPKPERNPENHH